MPNKLFVRPVSSLNSTVLLFDWVLFDISREKVGEGSSAEFDSIEQTLMQNGVEHVDLYGIWPASAAVATHVSLPGNQTRYIQQALPFAVEDQLAQDVDQLHLALGNKAKAGAFPVIGIDRELFEPFYELLSLPTHGFHLKGIFLDAECLPLDDVDMSIGLFGTNALVNSRSNLAITVLKGNLNAYLDAVFLGTPEEHEEGQDFAIRLYLPEEDADDLKILCAELEQYPHVTIMQEPLGIGLLELVCEGYFHDPTRVVNLCQGDYKPASSKDNAWYKWRYVAGIAVLGFLIQLGVFIGKGIMYEQQADEVGAQAIQYYKQAVPNARNLSVEKLPRIIKGKLNQAKQSGGADLGFLTLLGEAGYQFQRAPNKQGLAFRSLQYNAQRGELTMEMQAQNFDQLDRLKQAIVESGYSAKISSAVQEDNFFRGRISVSGS